MTLALQYLILLCQGIVLFSSVHTSPLMMKQREKTDGNMTALRP